MSLLFSVLIIVGCSPQKRLQRLIRKHPELVQTDTIQLTDTFISKAIQADTTYIFTGSTDTILLEKERLRVEIIRNTDTLYISGSVAPDTIIKTREIITEKLKVIKECPIEAWLKKWGKWLVVGLGIGVVLALCYKH